MKRFEPSSVSYLLREAGLILVFVYLYYFASSKTALTSPIIIGLNLAIFGTILIFLLGRRIHAGSTIDLPLAVMMLVMLAASLFSIDARRSFTEFWLVGLAVALYFMVSELISIGWEPELIVKGVLVASLGLIAMSWSEAIGWYTRWLAASSGDWLPDISFRLSNPNFLAVMFNLWLMVALARLISSKSCIPRILLSVYSFSLILLLIMTSSRGGWLGSAAGVLCLGLLFTRNRKEVLRKAWVNIRTNKFLSVGLIVAFIIIGSLAVFIVLRQMANPTHGSRAEFWGPAFRGFLDSPLIGQGPFTFISLYLSSNSVPPMIPFDYAHNIYLDLLSGTGLIGLAAFLWLMFRLVREIWKRILLLQPAGWEIPGGVLAALVAFLVHGLVDSVHHTSPISLWNLVILVVPALSVTGAINRPPLFRSLWKYLLMILTLAFLAFHLWVLIPMQGGVLAADNGDWSKAAEQFHLAARRDPLSAIAHQQEGLAYGMLAEGQDENLEHAIEALEKAVHIDPYWGLNALNLAALYRQNQEFGKACAIMRSAVERVPRGALYRLNLGAACEQAGDDQTALTSYRETLNLNPVWAEAHFWRSNELRNKARQTWLAGYSPPAEPSTMQREQAAAISPDSLSSTLSLITAYLDQGTLDAADAMILRAELQFSYNSQDWIELSWQKARYLALTGDKAAAADLGENAIRQARQAGGFSSGYLINPHYATFMFRVPAAEVDLLPAVERIMLTDEWGRRLSEVAQWYADAGNTAKSEQIAAELRQIIPNFDSLPE